MLHRTRTRLGALALAGLLAVAPVAGAVALAPAAAADAILTPCLTEEQAADVTDDCVEFRDDHGNLVEPDPATADTDVDRSELARVGIEPTGEELGEELGGELGEVGIEPISGALEAEVTEMDMLVSALIIGGMGLFSLASIGIAGYLLFRKRPVRRNAV